jgi:tetratricopeptide (TPR) repeat protein
MSNYTIHYKLKALKTSPTESRLYHNLGSYLVSIKSYRLGLMYLNKAIEMVPNHSFANWISAVAYTELEDYDKAMSCVNIAFENEASLYKRGSGKAERDLNTIRGYLYHKLGDSDKGIEDLEEALNINKDNSFALRNLGAIYYDLGQYVLACEMLQKADALGYEKLHDKDDLQAYLELSCENAAIAEDMAEIEEVTSVKTTTLVDKPYVYPNPTKGDIHIKNLNFKDYNYMVFDYTGKLVLEGESKSTPINLSQLSSGVYILKAIKNEQIETFRIIKD